MDTSLLLLFFVTTLPLILTPGPDILFVASQGMSQGRIAAIKSVIGVLLGYCAHGLLSAFGLATLVAQSPTLFLIIQWIGISYLSFLAIQVFRSALSKKEEIVLKKSNAHASIFRGFFTSFLNPKGLLIYLSILPQFFSSNGDVFSQSISLSLTFIISCGIVYSIVGLGAARVNTEQLSDNARRKLEGAAGVMLFGAAVKLAIDF